MSDIPQGTDTIQDVTWELKKFFSERRNEIGFSVRELGAKAGVSLSDIYYKYPHAFLTHIADNMATYLDEKI